MAAFDPLRTLALRTYRSRMDDPTPEHCRGIVPLLQARDGEPTKVELSGDRKLTVLNIAWGEDLGDDYEHLTANISPSVGSKVTDLFHTDEVAKLLDPTTGAVLWKTDGTPTVR